MALDKYMNFIMLGTGLAQQYLPRDQSLINIYKYPPRDWLMASRDQFLVFHWLLYPVDGFDASLTF